MGARWPRPPSAAAGSAGRLGRGTRAARRRSTPMPSSNRCCWLESRRDDGHLGPRSLERRLRGRAGRSTGTQRDPVAAGFAGSIVSGVKTSGSVRPIRKPGGATPTTVSDPSGTASRRPSNAGIAAEPALPEAVTENDDRVAAGPRLLLCEGAAHRRTDTEHREELGGRLHAGDLLRAVASHDVQRRSLHQRERLERPRPRIATRRS